MASNRASRSRFGSFSSDDEDSEVVSSSFNAGAAPIDAAHVPKRLWRHTSIERCANLDAKDESKVLVLYTGTPPSTSPLVYDANSFFLHLGGTIGMMRNENGGERLFVFTRAACTI